MRRLLLGSLAFTAAVSVAAVTHAHLRLTSPSPRHPDALKVGPCGLANDARGNVVTFLAPGSTVTVEWDEYVQHPGHFRIMFDEDGFDFPKPVDQNDLCAEGTVEAGVHCIADNITDQNTNTYSHEITLPNIECDHCTMQVIQYMTDKLNDGIDNELYYQCADLVLSAGAGGGIGTTTSSSTGTTTGAGGSGAITGAGGDNGIDVIPNPDDDGGCAIRQDGDAPASAGAAAALSLLALASRRRRRQAS